jgi:hypothetical protein
MTIDESSLAELLRAVPTRALSGSTRERTFKLARAQCVRAPVPPKVALSQRMLASAVPVALILADLVFLLDVCARMGRGFGR